MNLLAETVSVNVASPTTCNIETGDVIPIPIFLPESCKIRLPPEVINKDESIFELHIKLFT